MQGIDKVWAPLGGRSVLSHSVANLGPFCDEVVVVVRADQVERTVSVFGSEPNLRVVTGGNDRRASVSAGLHALGDVEFIAVHDCARPLATPSLLQSGREALHRWAAAIPVIPVSDTVKRVDPDGQVTETIPRDSLRLAQTPQLFRASALRQAHDRASELGEPVTDDASLLEAQGMIVGTIPGDARNVKITTPLDLQVARFLVETGS
jgi:2-C-methyl-D-erythritol 4-phosphate cytidylyltransferase